MPDQAYRQVQTRAFGELVRAGVYSADFAHSPKAKAFFQATLRSIAPAAAGRALRILDCGCGPGYWLEVTHEALCDLGQPAPQLYGFDITPEMIDAARGRLAGIVPQAHLRAGDILEDASYDFAGEASEFDVVFAYDVVQQLPRRHQERACRQVAAHVTPGGSALIFDQDWQTPFGLRMEVRKFITRHFKVPLVPAYYCNARYPALGRIGARLARAGRFTAEVRQAPDFQKRVLILRASGAPVGAP